MANKPLVSHFADDLVDVIDKYRNQGITICEVLGVFDLLKYDIIKDSIMDQEGENDDNQ